MDKYKTTFDPQNAPIGEYTYGHPVSSKIKSDRHRLSPFLPRSLSTTQFLAKIF